MQIIRRHAYARAGLVGNPSDGYHGKTISIIVKNFRAEVVLYEWEDVELVMTEQDERKFSSVGDLVRDVKLHGYYGGMRLLKATVKKVAEFFLQQGHKLHDRNFSLRYQSNIPRQVGLAGSSAIITASMRCLMDFYQLPIPKEVQPSLALSVEKDELGIAAGLQDRVIQVYEGLVYMDFAEERMRTRGGLKCGAYEPLDPSLLPPLYLAYNSDVSEPTEIFHNDLRGRFERREADVVSAMQKFAGLAAQGKEALLARDPERLAHVMNENFDTRRSICRLPSEQVRMIDVARSVGASAKFAGSGGAIVGTYRDETMYRSLTAALEGIGCRVIKPIVA